MDNQANTKSNSASSSVLQEIREVLAKITPGEWRFDAKTAYVFTDSRVDGKVVEIPHYIGWFGDDWMEPIDGEFLAAAPRLLRLLVAEYETLQLDLSAQVAESQRLLRDRDAFWLSLEAAEAHIETLQREKDELEQSLNHWKDCHGVTADRLEVAEARARENAEALLLAWGGVCPATWAIDPTNPMLMAERIRSRGDELQGQLEAAEARAKAAEALNREHQFSNGELRVLREAVSVYALQCKLHARRWRRDHHYVLASLYRDDAKIAERATRILERAITNPETLRQPTPAVPSDAGAGAPRGEDQGC